MRSAVASLLRMFLAVAMSFGFAAVMPAGDCGAPAKSLRCGCCRNPALPSCCAAPENGAPLSQPAAPSSRVSLQGQPAALPRRTPVMVLPPVAAIIFPEEKIGPCAGAAGHSFQSVNCVWTV